MNIHKYIFKVEYMGNRFDCGWQKQGDSLRSVQKALEDAAFEVTGEQINFVGSGRTDKDVNATGQIAHVDFARRYTIKALTDGMNWHLRDTGCRVLEAKYTKDERFHARFSAKTKVYEYIVSHSRVCSVFDLGRCWWIRSSVVLDMDLFHSAAQCLVGEYDFSSFRDGSCQATNPVRRIDKIEIEQDGQKICLRFTARSFLHKQIRIMVGTIVDIAHGRLSDMSSILAARDRRFAGQTAPGHGLFLREVRYDQV